MSHPPGWARYGLGSFDRGPPRWRATASNYFFSHGKKGRFDDQRRHLEGHGESLPRMISEKLVDDATLRRLVELWLTLSQETKQPIIAMAKVS